MIWNWICKKMDEQQRKVSETKSRPEGVSRAKGDLKEAACHSRSGRVFEAHVQRDSIRAIGSSIDFQPQYIVLCPNTPQPLQHRSKRQLIDYIESVTVVGKL